MKKNIKESFWNPTKYFIILSDMEDKYLWVNLWNNATSEQRNAAVEPIIKDFWKKYGKEIDDADGEQELLDDLEDNNFHTEARILLKVMQSTPYTELEESMEKKLQERMYDLVPEHDARGSFHGKAKVEAKNGDTTLYSYNTPIVKYTSDGKVFRLCDPSLLSATTMRPLREFIQQAVEDGAVSGIKKISKDWFTSLPQASVDESLSVKNKRTTLKENKKSLKESDEEQVEDSELIRVSEEIYDSLFNENDIPPIETEEVNESTLEDNVITFNYRGENYKITISRCEDESCEEEADDESLTESFKSLV